MAVRKYLFWKCKEGIRTYKVTQKGTFELLKHLGKDVYTDGDWPQFFKWFDKSAAITEDEYIDFCFLSDEKIGIPLLDYISSSKSSWDKREISVFFEKYVHENTYEIVYSEGKSFVCQNRNIFDKRNVKKMYMKCIPEFSIETEEKIDVGSEETSLVNRYFMDRLKELDGK